MRQSTALCVVVEALAFSSSALELSRNSGQPAAFESKLRRSLPSQGLQRRSFQNDTISNVGGLIYTTTLSVGNPKQEVIVQLDTGTSDFWMYAPGATGYCESNSSLPSCEQSGTYDPTASTSATVLNQAFNFTAQVASGGEVQGFTVIDDVFIGNFAVRQAVFGAALNGTTTPNVLGLGFPANEILVGVAPDVPTILDYMVAQGLIKWPAYSMYLNDDINGEGSIVFGGVDTSKYTGELASLPLLPRITETGASVVTNFIVGLFNMSIPASKVTAETTILFDGSFPVLLDPRNTLTVLPSNITDIVSAAFNVTDVNGVPSVDCSLATKEGGVSFSFAENATIFADLGSLVIPSNNGSQTCEFGIQTAPNAEYILGSTFMRSAYTVFDLGNFQVHIAPTVRDATTSTILEINTGLGAVPNVSGSAVAGASATSTPTALTGRRLRTFHST
ncbi:hypothetical protein MMC25_003313 [Agyrium rufum]|nr:hypothetical protein [Agyrium rufum]